MICIVDNNNIIVNIVNTNDMAADNRRKYYDWNRIGQIYTDIKPLEYARQEKLNEVNAWTASKITSGFVSNAGGETVTYDSDKDTQLTMQGIALNVDTERFSQLYPAGCPVRGVKAGNTIKTIQYLTSAQVLQWCADLSIHIGMCKQNGWQKQEEVNAATTVEELDAITLD